MCGGLARSLPLPRARSSAAVTQFGRRVGTSGRGVRVYAGQSSEARLGHARLHHHRASLSGCRKNLLRKKFGAPLLLNDKMMISFFP